MDLELPETMKMRSFETWTEGTPAEAGAVPRHILVSIPARRVAAVFMPN